MNQFSVTSRIVLAVVLTMLLAQPLQAQKKAPFDRVEPPFWFTGMKNAEVQLLFYNKSTNLAEYVPSISYPGISVSNVTTETNPHYLFVTLKINEGVKPGQVPIIFTNGKKKITYNYELRNKNSSGNRIQGFNSSDVVYLIMPDRFANGDVKNDSLPGMLEGAHREKPESRHGGDLRGISQHLDYIKDLGVTALWLNPVLENNQPYSSYHGYAVTDLYRVDRRFGSNDEYVDFVNRCHELGLKVIQDMVMNHIGSYHWLVQDLPNKDWIHQFPEFTRSNYQGSVISDPYQSEHDANLMSNGWFDTTMPDVNQKDSLFARYLIQNTLWWIEYAGIDGIRMDTYPYPDKEFMARWVAEVLEEYPKFNIVGEVWFENITSTAYWQKGSRNKDGYQSTLPSVTDFPFCFSVPKALNEPTGWNTGLRRLYDLLAQDFIYPDPYRNVIFLDNHDMSRTFLTLNRDVNKMKMALAFLLTTRGIPQLYYGTELLMDGDGGYHPNVRLDFPGGWPGDKINAFTREGRTAEQNEVFEYMKSLLNWRKSQRTIHNGKLTHFIPQDNVYVYFRHYNNECIMVIMNANNTDKILEGKTFHEVLKKFSRARNIITHNTLDDLNSFKLQPWETLIIELK